MKKIWPTIGRVAYWVTLPGLAMVLYKSRRTRVLVKYRGKILVVKPWLGNGKWGLPGGGVHSGENVLSAAIRETKEETGIILQRRDCKLIEHQTYHQNGLRFVYSQYNCVVKKKPQNIVRQKSEIIDVQWVAPKDLNAHNANYDVLAALKKLQ